jgi:CHAD domain-containing protein
MTPHQEREYKLRAESPLARDAVEIVLAQRAFSASATNHVDTYLDDSHASLAHGGIGLRVRRSGDMAVLCCKSEALRAGHLHTRRELEVPWPHAELPTSTSDLPEVIRDAVEPYVLTRALRPSVELTVDRQEWRLLDGVVEQGLVLLDHVTVRASGDRRASFCEVEVEIGADETACAEIADALASGLPVVPAATNKLAHALTLVGLVPVAQSDDAVASDVAVTLGELLAQRLAIHVAGIRAAEAAIRGDGGADHVHHLRVHLRRLRTLVSAFRKAWQPHESEWLGEQLAAWNRRLADLRDLDVASAEFERMLTRLPESLCHAADGVRQQHAVARAAALAVVRADLRSAAHLAMRTRLEDSAAPSHLHADLHAVSARDSAAERLARAARKLRKMIRSLSADVEMALLHEVRLAVKRVRYLAEECASVLPPIRKRVLQRMQMVQLEVGDVCDHDNATHRYTRLLAEGRASLSADAAALLGACAAIHFRQRERGVSSALQALARLDRRSVWREFRPS